MSRSLRIAIADDEPDIRSYFRRLLLRLGHEVVCEASTGRELVQMCLCHRPDLIVSDQHMPELSGIEARNEIAQTLSVPMIVVSAHDPPADSDRGDTILEFLTKPAKLSELEAAIERVCGAS